MAVTVVDTNSGDSGGATDTSFATVFPGVYTAVAGDVCIIFGHVSGVSLTMSIDGNFVGVPGFTLPVAQGSNSRMYVWYDVFTGGEGAPTITNSGSVTGGWEMIILRGADPADPFGQVGQATASATSINIASLTGVLAGSVLVVDQHARVASGTIPTGFTPDADYSEQEDHATSRATGSANQAMELATRSIASPGNFGGDTFSVTNGITSSIISLHIEVLAEVTEQIIAITQVTETDTARSLTVNNPIDQAIGLVTETDTARPLTVNNPILLPITQVGETDTAQALTVSQTDVVALTQVTETDTARGLTVVDPPIVAIGRVTETDTARGVTSLDPAIVEVGRVTETDTAQALSVLQGVPPSEAETFNDNFSTIRSSRWAASFISTLDGPDVGYPSKIDLDECVGQRSSTFRFELLDGVDGIRKGEVNPVRDNVPTLTHDTSRTTKRTVSPVLLTPEDTARVNPVRDRIDIFMVFDNDLEFPLGRYMFSDFTRIVTNGGTWASCVLLDEMFMIDQPILNSFSIAPSHIYGNIIESADVALKRLLKDFKTITIDAESTSYYSAGSWALGTRRGQIIDDMALSGDYMSPWFGNDKKLHLRRVFDPADSVPNFDWDARKFVLRNTITEPTEYLSAPNRILVISNDAVSGGQAQLPHQQIYGTYDIPASAPHSQFNRGFIVQEVFNMSIHSIPQATAIAEAIGQRTLNVDRVELTTPPDPRHDSYDVVRWDGENWLELSWAMPLTEGGEMQHVLRKAYA